MTTTTQEFIACRSRASVAAMLPIALADALRRSTGHGGIQDALDIQAALLAEASRWTGEYCGLPLVLFVIDGWVVREVLDGDILHPRLGWFGQPLENVIRAGFVRVRGV